MIKKEGENVLQNKKEQIYDILKDRILHQQYQLGERLNIGLISSELGVSNSPVREAMNLLVQEGLIINVANAGPSVVKLSQGDKFEIAQMLFFWASGAYRFSIHIGEGRAMQKKMRKILKEEEQACLARDAYQFLHQKGNFDRCIIETVKNHRLLAQYDAVFPLFFLVTLSELDQESSDWLKELHQHEEILKAIEDERHNDVIDKLADYYYRDAWGGFVAL